MNYTALKAKASSMISKYSDLTISYSVMETDGYTKRMNPVTNEFDWYLNGVVSTEPTPTVYTGKCLETDSSEYFKASSYVRENDRVFITSDIPEPMVNDKVTIGGEEFTIVRVRTVKPSSVKVLLKLIVRK